MTKEEKIKTYFDAMAVAIHNRHFGSSWGARDLIRYIQRDLDTIKELLEPESETLAASVLRLTNICNELGRENATLRNDLTDMTLNFNAAEKHARQLKEEIVRKNDTLKRAHSNLVWFKKAYEEYHAELRVEIARQNELLKEAETLKQELVYANTRTGKLQDEIDKQDKYLRSLRATCSKLMTDAGVLELRASKVMLLRRNQKLEEDLNLADTHIEELQKDLTSLTRQNWRRGK